MTTDELTAVCAAEIRAVLTSFVSMEHSADALQRGIEVLRVARQALEGPPAPHYYERPPIPDDPGNERAFKYYLDTTPFGGGNNPISPPGSIHINPDPDRPSVTGTVFAGRIYEGPAKCLHGGYVAGLFDHFLGMTQRAYGLARGVSLMAATRELTIRFLAPTPLDTRLQFEAWCEDVDERTIRGHGTCHADDVLTATAEGTFVNLGAARMMSTDPGGFGTRP